MAGLLGFEPRMTESESVALPLGDRPATHSLEALLVRREGLEPSRPLGH